MIVFQLILWPRTMRRQIDIVTYQVRKIKADASLCLFVDELFMSQKRLPKWRQHLFFKLRVKKLKNFVFFLSHGFVQISLACGSNTYQDFHCQRSRNGSIKCTIRKSNFAVNFPLKLFRATVANANTGSLKFLRSLFETFLDHILAKFESNQMI